MCFWKVDVRSREPSVFFRPTKDICLVMFELKKLTLKEDKCSKFDMSFISPNWLKTGWRNPSIFRDEVEFWDVAEITNLQKKKYVFHHPDILRYISARVFFNWPWEWHHGTLPFRSWEGTMRPSGIPVTDEWHLRDLQATKHRFAHLALHGAWRKKKGRLLFCWGVEVARVKVVVSKISLQDKG